METLGSFRSVCSYNSISSRSNSWRAIRRSTPTVQHATTSHPPAAQRPAAADGPNRQPATPFLPQEDQATQCSSRSAQPARSPGKSAALALGTLRRNGHCRARTTLEYKVTAYEPVTVELLSKRYEPVQGIRSSLRITSRQVGTAEPQRR